MVRAARAVRLRRFAVVYHEEPAVGLLKFNTIGCLSPSFQKAKDMETILHNELAHLCQLQRRKTSYVLTRESHVLATHTVIELPFHLLSNVALATRNRFSGGLVSLRELSSKLAFGSVPLRVWKRAGRSARCP